MKAEPVHTLGAGNGRCVHAASGYEPTTWVTKESKHFGNCMVTDSCVHALNIIFAYHIVICTGTDRCVHAASLWDTESQSPCVSVGAASSAPTNVFFCT